MEAAVVRSGAVGDPMAVRDLADEQAALAELSRVHGAVLAPEEAAACAFHIVSVVAETVFTGCVKSR
jgi:hypothetical protein